MSKVAISRSTCKEMFQNKAREATYMQPVQHQVEHMQLQLWEPRHNQMPLSRRHINENSLCGFTLEVVL